MHKIWENYREKVKEALDVEMEKAITPKTCSDIALLLKILDRMEELEEENTYEYKAPSEGRAILNAAKEVALHDNIVSKIHEMQQEYKIYMDLKKNPDYVAKDICMHLEQLCNLYEDVMLEIYNNCMSQEEKQIISRHLRAIRSKIPI